MYDPEFELRYGQEIFLFSKSSRTALVPTLLLFTALSPPPLPPRKVARAWWPHISTWRRSWEWEELYFHCLYVSSRRIQRQLYLIYRKKNCDKIKQKDCLKNWQVKKYWGCCLSAGVAGVSDLHQKCCPRYIACISLIAQIIRLLCHGKGLSLIRVMWLLRS